MKTITCDDIPFDVPKHIVVCPECANQIEINDIVEWDAVTGEISEAGFYECCKGDVFHGISHKYFQSDWQPVYDKIHKWLSENYRIGDVMTHTINGEKLEDAFDIWVREDHEELCQNK